MNNLNMLVLTTSKMEHSLSAGYGLRQCLATSFHVLLCISASASADLRPI